MGGQTSGEGGEIDLGELVEEDCAGDDAITSDSACLMCAIMLAALLDQRNFEAQIVCEILDPRTDRLLSRNKDLRQMCRFFRSNSIETGMFTMATSEPIVFDALMLLMTPGIGDLEAVPVSAYVTCPWSNEEGSEITEMSFWDLHTLVRGVCGDLLVGWHRPNEQPQLSPTSDKHQLLPWTGDERLLVVRKPLESMMNMRIFAGSSASDAKLGSSEGALDVIASSTPPPSTNIQQGSPGVLASSSASAPLAPRGYCKQDSSSGVVGQSQLDAPSAIAQQDSPLGALAAPLSALPLPADGLQASPVVNAAPLPLVQILGAIEDEASRQNQPKPCESDPPSIS